MVGMGMYEHVHVLAIMYMYLLLCVAYLLVAMMMLMVVEVLSSVCPPIEPAITTIRVEHCSNKIHEISKPCIDTNA